MDLDMPSLYKILKDDTRRKILLELHERSSLAYVDLMNILEITNTGKLNCHLKVLGDLLEKDKDGKYCLTEKGTLASQFLLQFPTEKPVERRIETVGDILVIGFVGFTLILANPSFLDGFLGTAFLRETWLSVLALVCALVVPGAIMWMLTVRRVKTHDFYHLVKPPLVSLLLLFGVVLLILFFQSFIGLKLPIVRMSKSADSFGVEVWHAGDGVLRRVTYQSTVYRQLVVWAFPLAGVYSFIGLGFSEASYRIFKGIFSSWKLKAFRH